MIRSIAVKFIAFVLAALLLVCAAASLLGIWVLGYSGLYDRSPQEIYRSNMEQQGQWIAEYCARRYASEVLGQCSDAVLQELLGDIPSDAQGSWNAVVKQDDTILWSVTGLPDAAHRFEYSIATRYFSVTPPEDASENIHSFNLTVMEDGSWVDYAVYQYESPIYTVIVQLSPSAALGEDWAVLEQLYNCRYQLIVLAAVSLLLFAALLVVLCYAAGRNPGSTAVRPGGLNRLPLDLYGAVLAGLGFFILAIGVNLLEEMTFGQTMLILGAMMATCLSLLVMALLFALAAQLKTKGGYWWRNSLLGRCLLLIGKGIYWGFRGMYRLFCLIPVVWRLALIGAGAGMLLYVVLIIALQTNDFLWELGAFFIPVNYAVLLGYLCYAYGTLYRGVQRMKKGDLSHKISTRFLFGSFKEFARGLNAVSEAAGLAAEKQLRSERMKTELITNVSHDIKTPLTSIINYVDLLQKPHDAAQEAQYLEVLSRQSLRLKKLVEDLMEMSKASTGNLSTRIEALDAVEAVNQALGEFSEKLEAAQLIPVVDVPQGPVTILADSRLLWRVLSNLLSNAVKYAMPGTRLYISIHTKDKRTTISMKNISREQLGISAEELLERFVRGDASRNTEGSGLGLNIAKSLMELQKGQLKLKVDGDLFKVTLVFPG